MFTVNNDVTVRNDFAPLLNRITAAKVYRRLNILISHGKAATDSSLNATVKELLKSVHTCQTYPKINEAPFTAHTVLCSIVCMILQRCRGPGVDPQSLVGSVDVLEQ